jgi:hypothetical protein
MKKRRKPRKRKPKNRHLRYLPRRFFKEGEITDEFRQFAADVLLRQIQLTGYKLARKREIAMQAFRHLITDTLPHCCVADSRNNAEREGRLRVQVWDAIVEAGFAIVCLGSEESGMVSLYAAADKLLAMKEEWKLRMFHEVDLDRNSSRDDPTPQALVVLKHGRIDLATGELLPESKRKKPISFREYVTEQSRGWNGKPDPVRVRGGMEHLRMREDSIDYVNESNLKHSWLAFYVDPETGRRSPFQPNVCVRWIHVGEPSTQSWRSAGRK